MNKIGICCDHAGYEMKTVLKPWLESKGVELVDFGTNSSESCDYADYAHPMAASIERGELQMGISICGSGNGINMTTNKHQGIRAALCWIPEISRLAREHNDANVCSLPGRFISVDTAKEIVDIFLSTDFEGGRHKTRIDKIPVI
jgi:ribose 5-phosphate isomerase B